MSFGQSGSPARGQSDNRAIGQTEAQTSFRKMLVWQEAQAFAREVAKMVAELPRNRSADVIGNQLMRSAGSIPANIAEGYGRFSQAAYRNHLSIARGSAFESESWLDLLSAAGYLSVQRSRDLLAACSRVQQLVSTRMKGLGEAKLSYAREDKALYGVEDQK